MALPLVLIAAAFLALAAAPAQAAFPGINGRVAYFQDDVGGLEDHGILIKWLWGWGTRGPLGPSCAEGRPDPCPRRPAWSPEGRRLAFDLNGRIGVMNGDGSDVRLLSFPGVPASRPAWSPAGDRLVFEGLPAGSPPGLYVARVDGSGLRRLVRGAQPAWSARNVIAFVRDNRLFRIRPDGSGLKRLTSRPGQLPDWSPDSRQLAFVRGGRIHRLVLGRRVRPYRVTIRPASNPVWTPNGRWIVFDRGNAGFRAIYWLRLSDRTLRTVTTGNEGRRIQVLEPDVQPKSR
jgi:Tol biopolymer transport system component